MLRVRVLLSVFLLFSLAACGAESFWASDEEVAKAIYVSDEPTSITLITVINNRDGSGGHSAIMINGSQKVLFDPAGTFRSTSVPERNDFLYGINPAVEKLYMGYHARKQWNVVTQKILVSPEIAEQVLELAKNYGAVPKGFCSNSTTNILRQVAGFESIPSTFFPRKTMLAFAELPGVVSNTLYEDD